MFFLSLHALNRSSQRQVSRDDVRSVLKTATDAVQQPNGRWRIFGQDLDGDDSQLVVAFGQLVEVVTCGMTP